MKTQTLANPLITSENMSSSIMGMDAKGADMATYYLRDKIYSDKILAVVREYICNALDEHKKHDIDRAVEVGIRDEDGSNIFFVRDFAKGLNENDIRNVFGMYFRSTKSGNNEQIGGFGIGSKAAHSYTDTFYVKSYHNGVCTLYACALGGGDTGVPVGHILKVSESPTKETGLEVYLEIKTGSDVASFKEKSQFFVRFCSANIVFDAFYARTEPLKPVSQIEKDGFVFRFFEKQPDFYLYNNIHATMGNVVYKSTFSDSVLKSPKLKEKLVLFIDVPIGAMSLPISRENFENTASNNRVLANMQHALREIAKEDIDSIKPMSLQELVEDRNNVFLHGENFSVYKKNIYSDVYPFITGISTAGAGADFEKVKGKPLCAIIKSRKTLAYWRNKFETLANKNGKKYYLVYAEGLSGCDMSKINEVFEMRNVKSTIFGWPKTAGAKVDLSMNASFCVQINSVSGYYLTYDLNALEVYNHICTMVTGYPQTANTIEEAKENMSKITFDSLKKLNNFTVKQANSTRNCNTTVTRSSTMHKNLVSLGFLDAESQEYKDKHKQISELEAEKSKARQNIDNLKKKFLSIDLSNSLVEKAKRNIKFAKKANCVFEKIADEISIRGKIIKTMNDNSGYYYSSKPNLSRQELRTILRLK
ncbi:MAG: ATP-binding protein [Flavobacteriia bacterium]|nr:ATP-binding protein [Flavobacteriia bacterium]